MTYAEIINELEYQIEYECGQYRDIDLPTLKETLDLVKRLKAENEKYKTTFEVMVNVMVEAKSEARKEFAERLLQRKYQSSDWSHGEHPFVVEVDDILDVLEEMG